MHIIYTLFIALANNVDNISVRIAYSIRGIKITLLKNLWISVITFVISSLAAFSGSLLTTYFTKRFSSILSMCILVSIGLWIIIEPLVKKDSPENSNKLCTQDISIYGVLRDPESADADNSKNIDFKEATFLGIALSINNIGGGIGAGMIGLNSIFVGFFSAIISFLALFMGNYISDFFNKFHLGKTASIISGLILIIIGINQIL